VGTKGNIWHVGALQKLFLNNELENRFLGKKKKSWSSSLEKRNKNI